MSVHFIDLDNLDSDSARLLGIPDERRRGDAIQDVAEMAKRSIADRRIASRLRMNGEAAMAILMDNAAWECEQDETWLAAQRRKGDA
jgi:hypothetical protein